MIVNPSPEHHELIPLSDSCVVSQEVLKEHKVGSIIVPFEKPVGIGVLQRGVVLAVGKGTPDVPQQVKYKDVVLFSRTDGVDVDIEGYNYKFIRQKDLIAIL